MKSEDLPEVSALGIRSKASWGYSPEAMETFTAELTLSEDQLATLIDATVAIDRGEIVGYYTLRHHDDGVTELEHLFVDPDQFARGIGSSLLAAAIDTGRGSGASELTIICDPNSTGFYLGHGAEVVGEHTSSIAGREIPITRIRL